MSTTDESEIKRLGTDLSNNLNYKYALTGNADALVKGDIYYNSIEMEVGAKIDGRLVVCSTDEELDLHKIDIESKENSTTIIDN